MRTKDCTWQIDSPGNGNTAVLVRLSGTGGEEWHLIEAKIEMFLDEVQEIISDSDHTDR